MVRRLNESGNLRHDHGEDFPNLRIRTIIYDSAHCRDSAISILGIAVDVSTIGGDIGVCSVEPFEQALRRVIHFSPLGVVPSSDPASSEPK